VDNFGIARGGPGSDRARAFEDNDLASRQRQFPGDSKPDDASPDDNAISLFHPAPIAQLGPCDSDPLAVLASESLLLSTMPHLPLSFVDRLLAEDVPNGDLTTLSLGIGTMPGAMEFRARQDMIAAGTEIAADMIRRVGADASAVMPSGSRVKAGAMLLAARGPAAALHHSWKA